jgi:glycosyltransferase involved in cell wall biosynthesis
VISICIVSSRPRRLEACLASLQGQESAPDFELLVCSDHPDPEVAATALTRFPEATVGFVNDASPAAARNFLVDRARADWLLFLDDDITMPPDGLHDLARLIESQPGVHVFGGPNLTPPDSSFFEHVQGEVLGALAATGPVRRRYRLRPPGRASQRSFMSCNLAIRRTMMRRFSGHLICAEENGVLSEMARDGIAMQYDPALFVYHHRRPDYGSFATRMRDYGQGRGQLLVHKPSSLLLASLAPALLAAYLLLLPLLVVADRWLVLPLLAYLAIVALAAARIGWSMGRPAAVPLAALLVVTLHICYGFGVWLGTAKGLRPASVPEHEWAAVSEIEGDGDDQAQHSGL